MKKIFSLLVAFMLAGSLLAQAPRSFNYQAVVRDATGNVITNTLVGMKISILQGSITGTAVCIEEFTPTTNDFGLVALSIGSENTTDFAAIDWSAGPYFVKVELDPAGGTSYTEMGTSQLLSVPFALYAEMVENVDDDDPDPSNELQAVSINNDTLYLSDGGQVYLGYLLDDADTQKLVLNDYYLGITNGNEITLPSVWNRIDSDITYDSGKVSITALKGDIQLHLVDAFSAGGYNLIIGDDAYLSDIDMYNTLGIFGIPDSTIGAIKLGSDGPVISGSSTNLSINKEMDMNNQKVVNMADPVNDQDAATKAYVDELLDKILQLEAEIGVKDVDGNNYKAVKIGRQVWMAENLKTTKYNDNTDIPEVTDNTEWSNLTTPGFCWYNNDAATYKDTYGALYNWYTVNTGKLCPTGWRVPTETEWQTLISYLGENAGGKLKETGTTHWNSPNTGATNESGFTGLPGGDRSYLGPYSSLGDWGRWWSSTESGETLGIPHYLKYDSDIIYGGTRIKKCGHSIRCLKD